MDKQAKQKLKRKEEWIGIIQRRQERKDALIRKRDRRNHRKNYKENRERILEKLKKKWKENPSYRISGCIRSRVYKALKTYTKTGKIMKSILYGIDYGEIIKHLEPFPCDLSEYHIDHIQPLCSFKFVNKDGSTNLDEVKKAFSPENHQWLLAKHNLSKGGAY